jgi:hypothetical protein
MCVYQYHISFGDFCLFFFSFFFLFFFFSSFFFATHACVFFFPFCVCRGARLRWRDPVDQHRRDPASLKQRHANFLARRQSEVSKLFFLSNLVCLCACVFLCVCVLVFFVCLCLHVFFVHLCACVLF